MKRIIFKKATMLATAATIFGGATLAKAETPPQAPMTFALKFVNYMNPETGAPVITREAADKVTVEMNEIYAQCGVQFLIDEIVEAKPEQYGFDYKTQSMETFRSMRSAFDNPNQVVIINTGEWNHGNMGSANAWTAMPGGSSSDPLGAILEAPVATFGPIVAHEIGHYLSLDHESVETNLMNPVIYKDSRKLEGWQCEAVRHTGETVLAGTRR